MDTIRIKKQKSSLQLFQEANRSLKKSIATFLNFVESEPRLSKENRLAVVSALFAPQWVKKATFSEMRIALVRSCWEKICLYPQNNIAVRQSINDIVRFAFFAQKNNNVEMLSKLSSLSYKLTQDEPILEPRQAQNLLRQSSWGINKAIALVLAKPGQWQKMSKAKKENLNYLSDHKRIWR